MKRCGTLLLLFVVLVCTPAGAQVAVEGPAEMEGEDRPPVFTGLKVQDSRLRSALRAAGAHWKVKTSTVSMEWYTDHDPFIIGRANSGTIYLSSGWRNSLRNYPLFRCNVLVHELGHVLGREHGRDLVEGVIPQTAACGRYAKRERRRIRSGRAGGP